MTSYLFPFLNRHLQGCAFPVKPGDLVVLSDLPNLYSWRMEGSKENMEHEEEAEPRTKRRKIELATEDRMVAILTEIMIGQEIKGERIHYSSPC